MRGHASAGAGRSRNNLGTECMPSKRSIERVCEACSTKFMAVSYEVQRGYGRFCSRDCQRSTQAKLNIQVRPQGIGPKERKRRWQESRGPKVVFAHHQVDKAKRSGELVPQPCEKCGKLKVDAHHDDYDKPLDVRWLCRKHHLEHHRSGGAGSKNTARPPNNQQGEVK